MWLFSAQPRTEMPVKQAFRLSKEHKRVSRVQCDAVTATGVGPFSSRKVGGGYTLSVGFAATSPGVRGFCCCIAG